MKTRTDLLNFLAEKHQLKRYLEIGVQVPEINFDRIKCEYKVSVDPDPGAHASFCMTSDEYFAETESILNSVENQRNHLFDLIFIDGLHYSEQVKKDFENSLRILSPNGFIVLHDCNPEKEEHSIYPRLTPRGHWNGDVYKTAIELAWRYPENYLTVDIDNGCGVFRNSSPLQCSKIDMQAVSWETFDHHRLSMLNLKSVEEFVSR